MSVTHIQIPGVQSSVYNGQLFIYNDFTRKLVPLWTYHTETENPIRLSNRGLPLESYFTDSNVPLRFEFRDINDNIVYAIRRMADGSEISSGGGGGGVPLPGLNLANDLTYTPNATTVTTDLQLINLLTEYISHIQRAFPVAGLNSAGLMDGDMYMQFQKNITDIQNLFSIVQGLGRQVVVNINSTTNQTDITNAFTNVYPDGPRAGDSVIDTSNPGYQWIYSGGTWVQVARQNIQLATALVNGIVANNPVSGGISYESGAGLGLVVGWDALVEQVTNISTAVGIRLLTTSDALPVVGQTGTANIGGGAGNIQPRVGDLIYSTHANSLYAIAICTDATNIPATFRTLSVNPQPSRSTSQALATTVNGTANITRAYQGGSSFIGQIIVSTNSATPGFIGVASAYDGSNITVTTIATSTSPASGGGGGAPLTPGTSLLKVHLGASPAGSDGQGGYNIPYTTTVGGQTGWILPAAAWQNVEVLVIDSASNQNPGILILNEAPNPIYKFIYCFTGPNASGQLINDLQVYIRGTGGNAQASGSFGVNNNLRILMLGNTARWLTQQNAASTSWS